MGFILEVIEGPHAGQSFSIRDGTEIGRVRGQILLKKDSKVSGFHAAIVKDPKGGLLVIDQGSSNLIKINGQKVKRVQLMHGVQFQIGRTVFKVIEKESRPEEPAPEPVIEKSWEEILEEGIAQLKMARPAPKTPVKAFKHAVRLDFIEGLQADEYLTLGFGPRDFGSDNLDIELKESVCPATAFTIAPSAGGAVFSTDFPRLVHVNGQSDIRHELQEGDTIRIGSTLIQVSFLK